MAWAPGADHGRRPLLITIDTEGDNLWARPRTVTTRNAGFLPRFQAVCETYGFKPTYLTNHEMACCPMFVEFARDVLARDAGELGMHLHAWNSPPLVPLTSDDFAAHPYLIEYPRSVMREKIARLTGLLHDVFQVAMVSHRAGRWVMNGEYARLLVEFGYAVDCSVTPHVSWLPPSCGPAGEHSGDYTACPEQPYRVDLSDIRKGGGSSLLEVPVTIRRRARPVAGRIRPLLPRRSTLGRAFNRFLPTVIWLRPNGRNRKNLQWLLAQLAREEPSCAEFMLHSSELMPGGSPTFRTSNDIERLYDDLHWLFQTSQPAFYGCTLGSFAEARHAASEESRVVAEIPE